MYTQQYIYCLCRSIVLDYNVTIKALHDEDKVFAGGSLGNFRSVYRQIIRQRLLNDLQRTRLSRRPIICSPPPPSPPLYTVSKLSLFLSLPACCR
jgi:hypothetical protein